MAFQFSSKRREKVYEVHEIVMPHLGHVPILKGEFHTLPKNVQDFIADAVDLVTPRAIYICDGSVEEADEIKHKLIERGTLVPLTKHENTYLCRTDPADVARVESKTWICTKERYTTVPHVKEGVRGILGQWISPEEAYKEHEDRWHMAMSGRTMYVIPFSMGPVGSKLSKAGVQLTDSNYVVLSMRVMTRVSAHLWPVIQNTGEFVKCLHSVGMPRPVQRKVINHWPCNPDKIHIAHFPEDRMVASYGSGYGGNSLLGKKCFALRIASCIARDEGWLAEHMLIMSVTGPDGDEKFIAAAFPSACGKTNMAMLEPGVPGWKVQCVGDDIAWMRFVDGRLRGINPEAGFFGVAPGTNYHTNPNAMRSLEKNSILTNVAMTADGSYYWEGLEKEIKDPTVEITTWKGEKWHIGEPGKAAHPNSRFCSPAAQCPIMHPLWEDSEGVPIDILVFGGRRPTGVPLVIEAFNWEHGVMLGAQLKSETTAAAEFKGKSVMHDPMAMRPFMGYNFGHYLQHWLDFNDGKNKMPKIFHVNWFRVSAAGKFLWPGFGENIRVIEWMIRRTRGEDVAEPCAVGNVPKRGTINMEGLGDIDWDELFSLPKDYWLEDIAETRKFLDEQVGSDLPKVICDELDAQAKRIQDS